MIAILIQSLIGAVLLTSAQLAGPRRDRTERPAHQRAWAWPLLITGQAAFLVYSAATDQIGFWVLNVGMIIIAAGHWRHAGSPWVRAGRR